MTNEQLTFNIKLDDGAIMPTKAHEDDAGFDIYSRQYATIYPHSSRCFDTGVHIEIPKGYVGFLKSKSGLNVNRNLVGDGVIDSGYTGSIVVKLYNKEGYIVADFFCGSGTTCVAAKNYNRQYIGIEIDEKFVKVARDRLNGIDSRGQMSLFLR